MLRRSCPFIENGLGSECKLVCSEVRFNLLASEFFEGGFTLFNGMLPISKLYCHIHVRQF